MVKRTLQDKFHSRDPYPYGVLEVNNWGMYGVQTQGNLWKYWDVCVLCRYVDVWGYMGMYRDVWGSIMMYL